MPFLLPRALHSFSSVAMSLDDGAALLTRALPAAAFALGVGPAISAVHHAVGVAGCYKTIKDEEEAGKKQAEEKKVREDSPVSFLGTKKKMLV